MSESESEKDPKEEREHHTGGLEHAPVTPNDEKTEPEAGTGSADKRSPESIAERDEDRSETEDPPGGAGGNQTH